MKQHEPLIERDPVQWLICALVPAVSYGLAYGVWAAIAWWIER